MNRFVVILAISLLVAPSFVNAGGSGSPSFGQTLVHAFGAGEPGLAVDARTTPWTIYVTAPMEGSSLWKSVDGGASYQRMASTRAGGGDADVAVDADGTLYVTDLLGNGLAATIPVAVSTNGGASWARQLDLRPNAPQGVDCDREWVAARGHGHAVVTARCGDEGRAWVTLDQGVGWTEVSIARGMSIMGAPVFAADGKLYAPYCTGSEVRVARSFDGGLTWGSVRAAPAISDCSLFPSLDVDDAGAVHLAVASGSGLYVPPGSAQRIWVYYTRSLDGGATWLPVIQVSDRAKNSVFAWVDAGAAGKVNVGFFTQNSVYYPEISTPVTTWDVEIAQSLDANGLAPTFSRSIAAPAFHTGSVCMSGLSCIGPQNFGLVNAPTPYDRRALDYFEIASDESGNALLVYPKDHPLGCLVGCREFDPLFADVDIFVAKQMGGARIR